MRARVCWNLYSNLYLIQITGTSINLIDFNSHCIRQKFPFTNETIIELRLQYVIAVCIIIAFKRIN